MQRCICTFSLILVISAMTAEARKTDPRIVDSLLTVAADTALVFDARKKIVRQAMGYDRSGKAMHAMARLYMSQKTVGDRQVARAWIERALGKESKNGNYRATLAELLWASAFRQLAYEEARKAVALEPNNVRALYMAGRFATWSWEMTHFTDVETPEMGRVTTEGVIVGRTFSQVEYGDIKLDVGIDFLNRALAVDPEHWPARMYLGLLYYEAKMPDRLVTLFEMYGMAHPENWAAWFFAGMGYQIQQDMESAYRLYVEGLVRMDERTKRFMQSIFMLRDRKAEKKDEPMPVEMEVSKFWLGQDPLYLTPINERLMEQCRRVAYANLRFGDPTNQYAGWETDRGQAYIRYGRPKVRFMEPAGIDIGVDRLPSEEARMPKRASGIPFAITLRTETWGYEKFTVTFTNTNSWDSWRFGLAKIGNRQVKFENLVKAFPSFYQYPFQYDIPSQMAQFRRDEGQTRVEVYYALPSERVRHQEMVPGVQAVDVKKGLFVFDTRWDTVLTEVAHMQQMPTLIYEGMEDDYLLAGEHVALVPGTYYLAGEAEDQVSKQVGTFRTKLEVRHFGTDSLAISDLLLGRRIEEREDRPFGRERFMILPNPLQQCRRDGHVSFYFEIYNLSRNDFGATHYQVSYKMRVLTEEPASGVVKPEWTTAVSHIYEGTQGWEPLKLRIDLNGASPGLREIHVVVVDLLDLTQVEGTTQFRVVW